MKKNKFNNLFLMIFLIFPMQINALDYELGKKLFQNNCSVCHANGNNLILPEKNLKKQALEINGMNNTIAINYQITNGKNGMPAFNGRLTETEIETITEYVLIESEKNFQN